MDTAFMKVEVVGRHRDMVKARIRTDENNEIYVYADADRVFHLMEGTIPISWIRRYAEQFPDDYFPFKKMLESWENV